MSKDETYLVVVLEALLERVREAVVADHSGRVDHRHHTEPVCGPGSGV